MPSVSNNSTNSTPSKDRLGEALLKSKLINKDQLQEALKRRLQIDHPLGSILIEMGFITADDLLNYLAKKFGVPAVNLFEMDISQNVLNTVPLNKIQQFKILPISVKGNILTLAMTSPHDVMTISDLEFSIGKKIKPMITPFFMMDAALTLLSSNYADGLKGVAIRKTALKEKAEPGRPPKIDQLIQYLVKSGASDMLLTAGVPPSVKIGSIINRLSISSLTPFDCENYARELLSRKDWETFLKTNDLDIAHTYSGIARCRINFYRQRGSIAITIRHLKDNIPNLKELNLPAWLREYALKTQGLILISGPAGHGKSTTLSAMVDIINSNRRCNIITLEDPVEQLHKHKKSNINQREVGRDTESFEKGLRAVFRQAPDVIVIGELRDKESFEIALRAARTGHLVLSTMNAASATAVIRIITNMFDAHQQHLIRMLLADSLLLSFGQRLVPNRDKTGVVIAIEKFINSFRVSNLIREGKMQQIRSQMETGAEEFTPIEVSLAELYKYGKIEFEDGLAQATNMKYYKSLTGIKE